MSNFTLVTVLVSGGVFLASGGYTLLPRTAYDPACDIKGNISYNSGEKIYHVRGQENYSDTKIRVLDGERWFCSEREARAAGWRKAGR
ncbi:hypothetical protein GAO09_27790 [Rhizobiales bacterium RZME27]|uniref:Uncharacterized protein n=1 Tax=Endobacterium cereale TaxID=2663029 RepID=A0A6A8AET4_9HYPH|nr:hypothetical protein [Endobacterium cereale]MEB2842908.1 hypothetical protein [Endobacterium cereale]MQY49835.1 hypothetical protein [Endobacterium cereale]